MPNIGEMVAARMVATGGVKIETVAREMRAQGDLQVSDAYLRSGKLQKTKAYQAGISKFAAKFQKPLNKALKALENKVYTDEKIPVLIQAVDVLNKNRRLEIGKDDEHTQPIVNIINYNTQVNIDTVKPNGKSTL